MTGAAGDTSDDSGTRASTIANPGPGGFRVQAEDPMRVKAATGSHNVRIHMLLKRDKVR
jgi:hypothetical protein